MTRVEDRIREFDEQYEPIPIGAPDAPLLFHFGDPPEVRRLRILPFIQLGLMAVILGLVWWSLRSRLERQRSLVWVGLARESAHQFGTPLSSLQGWLGLLGERISGGGPGPAVAGATDTEEDPPIESIVESMGEDVERLGRITNRFAKLGGPPGDERVQMDLLVGRVVDYMRKRAPQRNAAVVFQETYDQVPAIAGQAELLEWVVENLLKNALDALGGQPGRIDVGLRTTRDGRSVQLRVGDNGAGIAPADQRHIFDPGFSRKRRGWGLGLPLARRLVLAHGGRLNLVQSRMGEGSVFEVVLPAAKGVEQ
jgi:signal transduction histidine kinase